MSSLRPVQCNFILRDVSLNFPWSALGLPAHAEAAVLSLSLERGTQSSAVSGDIIVEKPTNESCIVDLEDELHLVSTIYKNFSGKFSEANTSKLTIVIRLVVDDKSFKEIGRVFTNAHEMLTDGIGGEIVALSRLNVSVVLPDLVQLNYSFLVSVGTPPINSVTPLPPLPRLTNPFDFDGPYSAAAPQSPTDLVNPFNAEARRQKMLQATLDFAVQPLMSLEAEAASPSESAATAATSSAAATSAATSAAAADIVEEQQVLNSMPPPPTAAPAPAPATSPGETPTPSAASPRPLGASDIPTEQLSADEASTGGGAAVTADDTDSPTTEPIPVPINAPATATATAATEVEAEAETETIAADILLGMCRQEMPQEQEQATAERPPTEEDTIIADADSRETAEMVPTCFATNSSGDALVVVAAEEISMLGYEEQHDQGHEQEEHQIESLSRTLAEAMRLQGGGPSSSSPHQQPHQLTLEEFELQKAQNDAYLRRIYDSATEQQQKQMRDQQQQQQQLEQRQQQVQFQFQFHPVAETPTTTSTTAASTRATGESMQNRRRDNNNNGEEDEDEEEEELGSLTAEYVLDVNNITGISSLNLVQSTSGGSGRRAKQMPDLYISTSDSFFEQGGTNQNQNQNQRGLLTGRSCSTLGGGSATSAVSNRPGRLYDVSYLCVCYC
jgi:hypothetical protein